MNSSFKPKRIPGNTNLRYWYESSYDGYPLMEGKAPFIEQYLEKLYKTMQYALAANSRVFAFRFDLTLPRGIALPSYAMTNEVIRRFEASLQEQIAWDRKRARNRSVNGSAHNTEVRIFWVRELGRVNGRPHYHCVLFLNGNAYKGRGSCKSECENIFHRIELAWARALRLQVADISGVVNYPPGTTYMLNRTNYLVHDEFFCRCSYLCKAATKHYGDGQHGCGGSRS